MNMLFRAGILVLVELSCSAVVNAGETVPGSVALSGTAEKICSIPSAPEVSGAAFEGSHTVNRSDIVIVSFADPVTGLAKGAALTIKFSDARCNAHARVGINTKNGGFTLGDVVDPRSVTSWFSKQSSLYGLC